jgi:multiple antibiotic resistance protein
MMIFLQAGDTVATTGTANTPILGIAEVFMLLFITLGPPLKTPAVYFARMQGVDATTQRRLAWATFAMATITVLIGATLGAMLRSNWHISIAAMLLAGGIIFFLVSLRTVLEQYGSTEVHVEAAPAPRRLPTAFELAVPMIITPYGIAAAIVFLTASHSVERTVWIFASILGVMVLHLLAMLFAGPIVRGIGPIPFKIFGTVIGSLTVGLSIQMMLAALVQLGLLPTSSLLGT